MSEILIKNLDYPLFMLSSAEELKRLIISRYDIIEMYDLAKAKKVLRDKELR